MENQYREIQNSELQKAYQRAYSLECREGWEAENRNIEYIGSTEKANGRITDYYKDSTGDYWYSTRYRRETGEIVSAETFIFGAGFQKRERERRRSGKSSRQTLHIARQFRKILTQQKKTTSMMNADMCLWSTQLLQEEMYYKKNRHSTH